MTLRDLLKKLGSGIQAVKKPLPPPVQIDFSQFKKTPRVVQAQRQTAPLVQQAQQLQQAARPTNVIRNAPAQLPRLNFAERAKTPVGRFIATIPQEILNAPRDVFAGSLGLGANLADVAYGKKPTNVLGNIGTVGKGFVNAYGGGKAAGLAKAGATQSLKALAKRGAIQGAKIGTAGGVAYGLADTPGTNKEKLKSAAKQGAMGAVVGAGLGAASPLVGRAYQNWKKAGKPLGMSVKNVGDDPLFQEARKYKSAEEFVGKQKPLYRATKEAFNPSLIKSSGKGTGLYATPKKSYAEGFLEGDRVLETLFIKPGAKVLKRQDFPERFVLKELSDLKKFGGPQGLQDKIAQYARNNGYDVVDYTGNGMNQIIVNPDVVATKSQLTDIYNQATTKLPSKTPTVGKVPQQQPLNSQLPLKSDTKVSSVSSNPFYNVNRINTSAKGKEAITEVLDQTRSSIEKVVGKPLTNKEVVATAKRTSDVLNKTVTRQSTEAKIAANLKLRQEIARASQEGKVTPELIEAIVKDKAAAADIARQLQARTINANPAEKTLINEVLDAVLKGTDDVDAVLEAAKKVDFNNQEQVTAFYRQFIAPRAEDWIDKLRYSSMLSSPTTHLVNDSSNLQGTGLIAPIEKTVAGGLDFLRAGVTGGKRTQFAGEGVAYAKGYWSNVGKAASRFGDVMKGKLPSTNPDARNIPLTTKKGLARTTENILSVPTRALEAADQFFTAMTEGGARRALEYRVSKGVKVGDIAKEAAEEAQYRLFRGELFDAKQGPILKAFDTLTKTIFDLRSADNVVVRIIAKFTLPFVKTGMNLLKQGVEYSPLGLSTIPGAANKTEQLAKVLMGTSVGIAAATLLGSDRLTWGEPRNQAEKNQFRASGKIPYAVKFGDTWVSYSKLHPAISFNFALVAALDDALKEKKVDESQANAILGGLSQWLQFYADQSYFRNIGDFLSATKGDIEGPARYLANYPQQLIPFRALLGYINRIIDSTQRLPDAENVIEKQFQYMLTQIPLLSGTVPARTTPDGAVVLNRNPILNAISPVRVSTESNATKPYISFTKDGKTTFGATASSGVYENKPQAKKIAAETMELLNKGEISSEAAAERIKQAVLKDLALKVNQNPKAAEAIAPALVVQLGKSFASDMKKVSNDYTLTESQKVEQMKILAKNFKETMSKLNIKIPEKQPQVKGYRETVNPLPYLGPITGLDGSSAWRWGLDVDLQIGTPIPSPISGQVISSGYNGGFGNQVKIAGVDGREYWLSHLSKGVAPGTQVQAGQIVGLGGNTGNVIPGRGGDGSHLDLTVVQNGRYIPPRQIAQLLKSYS